MTSISREPDELDQILKDLDQDEQGKTFSEILQENPHLKNTGLAQLAQAEKDGLLLCTLPLGTSTQE